MDRITGTPRPPSASTRQPALASFGGTANRPLTVSEIDLDQCDRIAMRLDEPEQVDMVLGDGARDRGAACELISTDPATGAGVALTP